MYANGRGVVQDYGQAVAWYRKAVAQNDLQALCALAEHYERGLGVPQDKQQAIQLYQRAIAQTSGTDAQQLIQQRLNQLQ